MAYSSAMFDPFTKLYRDQETKIYNKWSIHKDGRVYDTLLHLQTLTLTQFKKI